MPDWCGHYDWETCGVRMCGDERCGQGIVLTCNKCSCFPAWVRGVQNDAVSQHLHGFRPSCSASVTKEKLNKNFTASQNCDSSGKVRVVRTIMKSTKISDGMLGDEEMYLEPLE